MLPRLHRPIQDTIHLLTENGTEDHAISAWVKEEETFKYLTECLQERIP